MSVDPITWTFSQAILSVARWACRRFAGVAYALGYADGWQDATKEHK
jgi:hypothetical protein